MAIPRDKLIEGYGDASFRIDGVSYPAPIIVTAGGVSDLPVVALPDLLPRHLEPVFAVDPRVELLLIGTGPRLARPPAAVLNACAARGLGVDFMDSGAAARTYNVLLSEARRVAVILFAAA